MRVSVKKEHLLHQLPQAAKYALLESFDELPKTFIFEGMEMIADGFFEKCEKEYPEIYSILTPNHWHMFCEMVKNPNGATYTQLRKYCTSHTASNLPTNTVQAAVCSLRKKLVGTKFSIKTRSIRYGVSDGKYQLIKT